MDDAKAINWSEPCVFAPLTESKVCRWEFSYKLPDIAWIRKPMIMNNSQQHDRTQINSDELNRNSKYITPQYFKKKTNSYSMTCFG